VQHEHPLPIALSASSSKLERLAGDLTGSTEREKPPGYGQTNAAMQDAAPSNVVEIGPRGVSAASVTGGKVSMIAQNRPIATASAAPNAAMLPGTPVLRLKDEIISAP
jgi:hypothetical protein